MKCSKDSVREFIKDFLSLQDTPFCFHQVLTFKGEQKDRQQAKDCIESLLDILRKQFPFVALFTEQGHWDNRIHFHVAFLFYPEPSLKTAPDEWVKVFGSEVFRHWKRITGQKLHAEGNQISQWKGKELGLLKYLLHEVTVIETKKEKGKTLWHGKRGKKLAAAHLQPVTNKQIREAFEYCLPYRKEKASFFIYDDLGKEGLPYYDKERLREYRKQIDATGELWRKHKDRLTGIKNCTDAEFRRQLNQKLYMSEHAL